MDDSITQSSHWWRSQLERQLQKLVRAISVLGYCRHSGAIEAVSESVQEVEHVLEQTLAQQQDAEQVIDERTMIETHVMLAQARKVIGLNAKARFADANVVELRDANQINARYSDLADAEFERMLAASDVPNLYSSTAASESRCFGPEQANDTDDFKREKPAKANFLSLVSSDTDNCPSTDGERSSNDCPPDSE